MDFIDPLIEQYALDYTENESSLLNNLSRQTHLNILQPRMLSGHLQGRLLSSFSKALNPQKILEIGTYTGYSALCLAEGLNKNGQIKPKILIKNWKNLLEIILMHLHIKIKYTF